MFGIRFIKVQPTDYILQYRKGALLHEGAGLAFFYFAPTTSLVRIPMASVDVPFIFEEFTADFQAVTIQGQLSYRISDAKKLSQLMNYTLAANGKSYSSDDPTKLPQRIITHAHVLTRAILKQMTLRAALGSVSELVKPLSEGLQQADLLSTLGVELLGVSIVAIKPTPETARALEAEAREQILGLADEAIFIRRNAAVEQERAIKENELNTEIAVENKKRQIQEAKMEAEKSVQRKRRELQEAEMSTRIALEEQNRQLVELAVGNARQEADSKAYAVAALMRGLEGVDPKVVQVLASVNMKPDQMVAQAFTELATNAEKIGELNVSPDLLKQLIEPK